MGEDNLASQPSGLHDFDSAPFHHTQSSPCIHNHAHIAAAMMYTVRHFGGWMSFTRTTEMRYEFGHRVGQVDGLRATGWMYGLHEAHE